MSRSGVQRVESPGGGSLKRGLPGALSTSLVLVVGAVATWLAYHATLEAEARTARDELALRATEIESAIETRLLAAEGLLRAGAGVINAFWPVSGQEWQLFSAELRLASIYSGIQGIGFATRVNTPAQLSYWASTLRPLGTSELLLRAAEGRAPETAVVFLEPLDEHNLRAIGFDMMSEPSRRYAMERARDEGTAALSHKVTLVQDSRAGISASGFLLYVPVYSTGVAPAALSERRRALRGYVYSPFRAEDFFVGALQSVPVDAALEVFDGGQADASRLLYRSVARSPLPERFTDTRRVTVAGQEWTLRVSPSAAMGAAGSDSARLVAVSGAAITLLFSAIVTTLALSRQRLHERVEADNALALRERQASQVLENALDAYIAIDADDVIIEWNQQAAAIFGWLPGEAIGKRLTETIIPAQLRERHAAALSRFAARQEHPLFDRRLEMPALRKDGGELLVELSIVKISAREGLRFAASLRDVTQRRRQEVEIRELNEKLEQRVAERTTQLESANRELSVANRDLEAFAYSVSHDLRAPLRAIDGHVLRLTEQVCALDEAQRHHTNAVHRNIRHMNQLIDDLLNFAFVSRRPLEKQTVALWEIVRPILQELPAAPSSVYDINPEDLGAVHADPALLAQALTNLLSNAAKFSRDASPPRIGIGSEHGPQGRAYYVRDNGVGFDMQYAGKLFGVFERLHTQAEFEGTGVGLAIVKQIIERHGGQVWAESEPGRGATFWFTLP